MIMDTDQISELLRLTDQNLLSTQKEFDQLHLRTPLDCFCGALVLKWLTHLCDWSFHEVQESLGFSSAYRRVAL